MKRMINMIPMVQPKATQKIIDRNAKEVAVQI